MKRKLKLLAALAAIMLTAASSLAPVQAGDFGDRTEWTIKLKTEEIDRYLKTTNLFPLAKVNVFYYKGNDEKSATHYQKIFFHEGKPVGLERLSEFKMEKGESVRIVIAHKTGAGKPGEMKAAANAILKLWLDTHLNQNQLTAITVPAASLQGVADEMVRHRCQVMEQTGDVEKPSYATMTTLLKADSGGKQIHMAYFK